MSANKTLIGLQITFIKMTKEESTYKDLFEYLKHLRENLSQNNRMQKL